MTTKTELKRCTKCVMPETWSGISFDKDGVCSICQEDDKIKNIDWGERAGQLEHLLDYYRKSSKERNLKYDCLIGYSGGKDTAYTLYMAVKKLNLRPLVVTFDHGFNLTPEGQHNLWQIPKELDCDHLTFTLGNGLRNALCRKGSEVIGDFCIHCHRGVGTFAANVSYMYGIPLQLWGEPTSIYQTSGNGYKFSEYEEQNKDHFERLFSAGTTPESILPDGYELRDLNPLTWPNDVFALKAIYLGSYIPWSQAHNAEVIKKELGWQDYPKQETWQSWDKNDCPLELVREAQKLHRRGFGKASFAASKEIREGKITRERGMELVNEYENKKLVGLDDLCAEMGMTFEELIAITNKEI